MALQTGRNSTALTRNPWGSWPCPEISHQGRVDVQGSLWVVTWGGVTYTRALSLSPPVEGGGCPAPGGGEPAGQSGVSATMGPCLPLRMDATERQGQCRIKGHQVIIRDDPKVFQYENMRNEDSVRSLLHLPTRILRQEESF